MRATVVVPTYRRPADLSRCLTALQAQLRRPDEVMVTVRPDDAESLALLDELSGWPALRVVRVERPGVVVAMNTALDAATGDVVALTDDDAEPASDWLERMMSLLELDPSVAGVGGRDEQAGVAAQEPIVGKVQWFGRVIGNHHTGTGPARDVDVLKGVCCAFRATPLREIRFDDRLRGAGAQVHWELNLCLALRRKGWRLVYDPDIRVRHHVAPRHDADQLHRGRFDTAPLHDAVYNETLALVEHLTGMRAFAFRVWSMLVGTAESPGLLMVPRVLLREGTQAFARYRATQRARAEALR